jgi:hypothetical protein
MRLLSQREVYGEANTTGFSYLIVEHNEFQGGRQNHVSVQRLVYVGGSCYAYEQDRAYTGPTCIVCEAVSNDISGQVQGFFPVQSLRFLSITNAPIESYVESVLHEIQSLRHTIPGSVVHCLVRFG